MHSFLVAFELVRKNPKLLFSSSPFSPSVLWEEILSLVFYTLLNTLSKSEKSSPSSPSVWLEELLSTRTLPRLSTTSCRWFGFFPSKSSCELSVQLLFTFHNSFHGDVLCLYFRSLFFDGGNILIKNRSQQQGKRATLSISCDATDRTIQEVAKLFLSPKL